MANIQGGMQPVFIPPEVLATTDLRAGSGATQTPTTGGLSTSEVVNLVNQLLGEITAPSTSQPSIVEQEQVQVTDYTMKVPKGEKQVSQSEVKEPPKTQEPGKEQFDAVSNSNYTANHHKEFTSAIKEHIAGLGLSKAEENKVYQEMGKILEGGTIQHHQTAGTAERYNTGVIVGLPDLKAKVDKKLTEMGHAPCFNKDMKPQPQEQKGIMRLDTTISSPHAKGKGGVKGFIKMIGKAIAKPFTNKEARNEAKLEKQTQLAEMHKDQNVELGKAREGDVAETGKGGKKKASMGAGQELSDMTLERQQKRDQAREIRQQDITDVILPSLKDKLEPLQKQIDEIKQGKKPEELTKEDIKALGKIKEQINELKLSELSKPEHADKLNKLIQEKTGEKISLTPEKKEKIDDRIKRKMESKEQISFNEFSEYMRHIAINTPHKFKAEKDKLLADGMDEKTADAAARAQKKTLDDERNVFKSQLPVFISELTARWKDNPPKDLDAAVRGLGNEFIKFVYEKNLESLDPANKDRWVQQFNLPKQSGSTQENIFNEDKQVAVMVRYLEQHLRK